VRAYIYNIELDYIASDDMPDLTEEELTSIDDKLAKLSKEHDLGEWYRYRDSFSCDGELSLGGGRGHDEFAYEVSKEIFRIFGRPVDITWAWWFQDRDPDDYTNFDEEAYWDMIEPLVQLAHCADNEKEPD
jgi:hypothetical protein